MLFGPFVLLFTVWMDEMVFVKGLYDEHADYSQDSSDIEI